MYIKYNDKKYYWNLQQFKSNLFQLAMFTGAIVCFIIGGKVCNPF